jgi:hypothetical protein
MYKWSKDIVNWTCGNTLYISVVFSWDLPKAEALAKQHKKKVIVGGPAAYLNNITWATVEKTTPFDVLAMHNPFATFTTRGCPNGCGFCAVPRLEGEFRELPKWKPAPVICDNNLLAASDGHFLKVIDSLMAFPACDFNQGLDARLFTAWHAGQIAKLNKPIVRFAFDHTDREEIVETAILNAKSAGLKDIRVYVLIGWNDTPVDAFYRLEQVRAWECLPNPMRYQPLDTPEKNSYRNPEWSQYEFKRMMRYYSRLNYLGHIPFCEYQPEGETLFAEVKP